MATDEGEQPADLVRRGQGSAIMLVEPGQVVEGEVVEEGAESDVEPGTGSGRGSRARGPWRAR